MADYGILPTGFVPKTYDVIRDRFVSRVQGRFGASLDLSDSTLLGFILSELSNSIAELWELGEAVYSSADADKANGEALVALAALTGTFPIAARPSTVTLTLTGNPTSVVSAGSRAATASTAVEFATDASRTIAALSSWSSSTAYALEDRVTLGGSVYQCVTAGTSAGSGGPTGTATDITDGTAHWRYLGAGTGAVDVEATCTVTGAVVAVSGDVTEIVTPASGWQGVVNVLDAELGRDVTSNEELRLRRLVDLASPGTGVTAALRQALAAVDGVTSVLLIENFTGATVDGVPAHHVECLIEGGDDQKIRDVILANKPVGAGTHGNVSGTATDEQGTHTISFSRPTDITIYLTLNVSIDAAVFPSDGVARIKELIALWGDAQGTGRDAIPWSASTRAALVPGVLNVTSMFIGTSPSPASSSVIAIATRERASWDTSRIVVNTTAVTP